jgi:hypothetical protein
MSVYLVIATSSDAYCRPIVSAVKAGLPEYDVQVLEVRAAPCL